MSMHADTMLLTGDGIHAKEVANILLFSGSLTGISIDRFKKVWNHGT